MTFFDKVKRFLIGAGMVFNCKKPDKFLYY